MNKISVLLVLSYCLFITCSSFFGSGEHVQRGSLSEAMEKSSDDYEGERKVEDSRKHYYENDDNDEDDEYYSQKRSEPSKKHRARVYFNSTYNKRSLFPSDTIIEKATDSSGEVDLEKYRVQLALPFVLDNNIDRITISSSDSSGKSKSYVLEKQVQTQDTLNDSNTVINKNDSSETDEWVVEEQMKDHYLGFRFITGLKYSSNYSNITGGSLTWAYHYDEKRRSAIHFGAAFLPSKEDSDLLGSIDNIWELHLGYEHRFYLTPDKSFLGVFIPLNATVRALFWKYRNPITTDVYDDDGTFLYDEEINGDGLWGVSIGSGFGVSLIQTNFMKLSAAASCGGTLYGFETHEGFDNDVFVGDLYLKLSVEMLFGLQ